MISPHMGRGNIKPVNTTLQRTRQMFQPILAFGQPAGNYRIFFRVKIRLEIIPRFANYQRYGQGQPSSRVKNKDRGVLSHKRRLWPSKVRNVSSTITHLYIARQVMPLWKAWWNLSFFQTTPDREHTVFVHGSGIIQPGRCDFPASCRVILYSNWCNEFTTGSDTSTCD